MISSIGRSSVRILSRAGKLSESSTRVLQRNLPTASTTASRMAAVQWKSPPSRLIPERFYSSSRSNRPSSPLRQALGGSSRAPLRRFPRNSNERDGRADIPTLVWIGAGLPVIGGIALYYHYLDRVPLTERQRWIATSPEWERSLGDQEYQQLLQQYRQAVLPPNHRASITVQRVGLRIHKAAQTFLQEHLTEEELKTSLVSIQTKPTFTVVRSEHANAFVLPNNHIFVMTGLFQYAQDEDELASVIGHEMAHNLARHVGEKISGNLVIQGLARLSLLADPSGTLMLLFLPAANLFRELPHSRIQELEADQIGMHLAATACYDPAAAQRVFRRMKAAEREQGTPPQFLSTHPSHDSRLTQMEAWLPEANSVWQRDDEGATCRHLREEMAWARQIAAQRAPGRAV